MAEVYIAKQHDLDRLVALKKLHAASDSAQAERFRREALMAGRMSHPNIVTVYAYLEDEGTPYIAMEYVEGGSLRPWIGWLTMNQIAGVVESLLAALDHAETHGIVHRDLKPENVLVTRSGQVKVADFGIAHAGSVTAQQMLTTEGMTVGTPTYMAPEQAMRQQLGPYTDLYSLGVMVYELVAGKPPFEDDNPLALCMKHQLEPVAPLHSVKRGVDEALSEWVDRLLAKRPDERFQSASEAWNAFEPLADDLLELRWRRTARLLSADQQSTARPLSPATFTSATPQPPPRGAGAAGESRPGSDGPRTGAERRRGRTFRRDAAPTPPAPAQAPVPVAVVTPPSVEAGHEPAPPVDDPQVERELSVGWATADPEALVADPQEAVPTVEPAVVPDAPAQVAEREQRRRARRRKSWLVAGAGCGAVALAAGGIAAFAGKDATTTPSGTTQPEAVALSPPGLELRGTASAWAQRADVPGVPGLSRTRARALGHTDSGGYVAAELIRGDAAPSMLPKEMRAKMNVIPAPTEVTLNGVPAYRYDDVAAGAGQRLRVYAALTDAGVATIVCAKPVAPADCDALAGTLELDGTQPAPLTRTANFDAAVKTTFGDLDERVAAANARLDNATKRSDTALALSDIARRYTSAASALDDRAGSLNPVEAGLKSKLTSAFTKVASAYAALGKAVAAGDPSAVDRAQRSVNAATGTLDAAVDALQRAGVPYAPRRHPRTKIELPASTSSAPVPQATGPQTQPQPQESPTPGPQPQPTPQPKTKIET